MSKCKKRDCFWSSNPVEVRFSLVRRSLKDLDIKVRLNIPRAIVKHPNGKTLSIRINNGRTVEQPYINQIRKLIEEAKNRKS
jgi:hypothetical protein